MKIKKNRVWVLSLLVVFSIVLSSCTSKQSTNVDDTKQTVASDNIQTMAPTEEVTDVEEFNSSFSIEHIPEYADKAYIVVNNNKPEFTKNDLKKEKFEYYSPLDSLGRCGYAMVCVSKETIPTGTQGSVSNITPTGWKDSKYSVVEGEYLYNRCNLIGWQLVGGEADNKNLITSTRYMKTEGILPFENMIFDYVNESGNHVMYRVTPIFEGDNLLASGVHLEGYSVEDNGAENGICFNVYVYNVQPNVILDYSTGESRLGELPEIPEEDDAIEDNVNEDVNTYIINKNTGTIHFPECASAKAMKEENKIESNESLDDLINKGYKACGNCKPS